MSKHKALERGWSQVNGRYVFRFSATIDNKEFMFRSSRVFKTGYDKYKHSHKDLRDCRNRMNTEDNNFTKDKLISELIDKCSNTIYEINKFSTKRRRSTLPNQRDSDKRINDLERRIIELERTTNNGKELQFYFFIASFFCF